MFTLGIMLPNEPQTTEDEGCTRVSKCSCKPANSTRYTRVVYEHMCCLHAVCVGTRTMCTQRWSSSLPKMTRQYRSPVGPTQGATRAYRTPLLVGTICHVCSKNGNRRTVFKCRRRWRQQLAVSHTCCRAPGTALMCRMESTTSAGSLRAAQTRYSSAAADAGSVTCAQQRAAQCAGSSVRPTTRKCPTHAPQLALID